MIINLSDYSHLANVTHELRRTLGYPCFGSKSGYSMAFPDSDPVFNAYMLWQDSHGLLWPVWGGDLELTKCPPVLLQASKNVSIVTDMKRPASLFVYRESHVHNQTFNDRPFPYDKWVACVKDGLFHRSDVL